jgi:hypothetical protein
MPNGIDLVLGQFVEAEADEPPSALEYVRDVYKGRRVADPWRMRAAMAALPFESPKLSAMAIVERSDFASMLDKAIERSAKARDIREIEAEPEGPVRRRGGR